MGDRKDDLEPRLNNSPTYVLTPVLPEQETNWQLPVLPWLRLLWSARHWILIAGAVLGLATFLSFFFRSPRYEARATLMLQPLAFSTELRPAPLAVEAYTKILESDIVFDRVRERLIEAGLLPQGNLLEDLKASCRTEVYASREVERAGERPFMPLIDLVASDRQPERAAAIANAWAEAFLTQSVQLSTQGMKGTLDFIETQYPLAQESLATVESELKDKQDFYDNALVRLERQWSVRIAAFKNETSGLISEYSKETERLRRQFFDRWKPNLLDQQLEIKLEKLAVFEDELLDADVRIKSLGDTLAQLNREIQSQPKFLVASKAITDEALWEQAGKTTEGWPTGLDDLKLRTEVMNPAYESLVKPMAALRVEYDSLQPRRGHLQEEVQRIRKGIDELQSTITEKQIELFNLTADRQRGLAQLEVDRESELAILERARDNDLSQMRREKQFTVGALDRQARATLSSYELLAEKYESARMARAEVEPDVRIGARAVLPSRPVSTNRGIVTVAAALLGCVLASLFVLMQGVSRSLATAASSSRAGSLVPQ